MNGAAAVAVAVTLVQYPVLKRQVAGLSGAAVAVAAGMTAQKPNLVVTAGAVFLVDQAVTATQMLSLAQMVLSLRAAVVAPNLLMVAMEQMVAAS
jgi:hypothetical protein